MAAITCSSQTRFGVAQQSGFNRIGLYFDTGLTFNTQRHEGKIGLRYYGPDYVFEKNTIGLSAEYKLKFYSGSWFFGPGVSCAFFDEKKSNVTLALAELVGTGTMGYEFGKRFALYSNLGIGAVIHQHSNILTGTNAVIHYINYEFSLGLHYYWRVSADN